MVVSEFAQKMEARKIAAGKRRGRAANVDMWNIDPLDAMSAAQFERMLVDMFGPQYLEPVPYVWVEGRLVAVTTE